MITMETEAPDIRGKAARRANLEHLALLLHTRAEQFNCPRGATEAEFELWCRHARPLHDRLKKRAGQYFKQMFTQGVKDVVVPARPHTGRCFEQQMAYVQAELSKIYALPYWEQQRHRKKRLRLEYRNYLLLWVRRFKYRRVLSLYGKKLGHSELALHTRMADAVVLKGWKDPTCNYAYVLTRGRGWLHGCFHEHSTSVSLS